MVKGDVYVYVCVGGSMVALMVGGEEAGLCKGNE